MQENAAERRLPMQLEQLRTLNCSIPVTPPGRLWRLCLLVLKPEPSSHRVSRAARCTHRRPFSRHGWGVQSDFDSFAFSQFSAFALKRVLSSAALPASLSPRSFPPMETHAIDAHTYEKQPSFDLQPLYPLPRFHTPSQPDFLAGLPVVVSTFSSAAPPNTPTLKGSVC